VFITEFSFLLVYTVFVCGYDASFV